ncbi:MAG: hypothetical protein K6T85_08240 [Gorillibacterium sp.]|nr:hypothetical protein [Gorillibacterium sp.]
MAAVRRNLAIPTLIIALIIIGIMLSKVYTDKDQQIFTIKDLQGDHSAIEDVRISGDLSDGYHRTQFTIDRGQISTNTELSDYPEQVNQIFYTPGKAKLLNGLEYELQGSITDALVIARDQKSYDTKGTALVRPAVVFKATPPPTPSSSYLPNAPASDTDVNTKHYTLSNVLEYGLAQAGDKIYYTVPTTKDWIGTNGIYELNFTEAGNGSTKSAEPARVITTFSLDQNKGEGATGIEVLGLEAVGDKLALLIVENNQLIVRGFDSKSGKELGQAVIDHFAITGGTPAVSSDPSITERFSEPYGSYVDPDKSILNLSFRSSLSSQSDFRKTIWSLDFSEGVKVINKVDTSNVDGQDDTFGVLTAISYRNGKLYVVKVLNEVKEKELIPTELIPPKRFMIYVYQKATLIYKGELVTDLNDDLIKTMNLPPSTGLSYAEWEYRAFRNIQIR